MTAAVPTVLVPEPLRRPVGLLVAGAATTFAVLAARYAGTSEAGGVDTRVDAVVDPLGMAHRWLVRHIVALGSPPSVVVLAFAASAVCLVLGRRRLAVLAVVGPGVTGVCTTLLKPALGRTIGGGFAFPSGHTGGATSLGLVAALLAISLLRPSRGGALAILAAGALVIGGGVGAALIASNAHYPTDTIGGFCTAVVVVCGGALALDRMTAHRAWSGRPTRST
jgi:membrane-associated phospholipid phosphatase